MIRVKHCSGSSFSRVDEPTSYLTTWNKSMNTKGGIRLYESDVKYVVDFRIGDQPDELLMASYPHNDKTKTLEWAEELEAQIRAEILSAVAMEPTRVWFTFDLKDGKVKLLKKEHFNRYSSLSVPQDELFCFDNPDPELGFPRLYIHEKNQKTSAVYGDVFRTLVKTSRVAFPAAQDAPTEDGKNFTYMLLNSYAQMQFESSVPNLRGIEWPTKLSCYIPEYLNMEALQKFLSDAGVDKLIMKDGKVVEPEGSQEDPTIDDSDWEDEDMPDFPFGMEPKSEEKEKLATLVWKMIQEKGYFNFGDAFTIGFERILGMIPISPKVIHANMDFPGMVRKMCVCKGMFYIIPLDNDLQRIYDVLDLDESSVNICTDETYPRNNAPLLPAPEY